MVKPGDKVRVTNGWGWGGVEGYISFSKPDSKYEKLNSPVVLMRIVKTNDFIGRLGDHVPMYVNDLRVIESFREPVESDNFLHPALADILFNV